MASTTKNTGSVTYNPMNKVRVLSSVTFTVNDTSGDFIDVSATLEYRDSITNEVVSTKQVVKRFTSAQADQLLVAGIQGMPNTYDKLRNSLALFVHSLVDAF